MTGVLSRRPRPEDGGIVWHGRWNAFECLGCGEMKEVRQRMSAAQKKAWADILSERKSG